MSKAYEKSKLFTEGRNYVLPAMVNKDIILSEVASAYLSGYDEGVKDALADKKAEWIKVEDGLPNPIPAQPQYIDMSDFVLTVVYGRVGYGRYSHDRKKWFASIPKKGGFFENVTHWMPLPQSPDQSHDNNQ